MKYGYIIGVAAIGLLAVSGTAKADAVKICTDNDISNTYLAPLVSSREVGIVVTPPDGRAQIRANNHYQHGAGSYWNNTLPLDTTLYKGCTLFQFMSKNSEPDQSQQWQCDTPSIVADPRGGTWAYGTAPGASTPVNSVHVPKAVKSSNFTTDSCPSGN